MACKRALSGEVWRQGSVSHRKKQRSKRLRCSGPSTRQGSSPRGNFQLFARNKLTPTYLLGVTDFTPNSHTRTGASRTRCSSDHSGDHRETPTRSYTFTCCALEAELTVPDYQMGSAASFIATLSGKADGCAAPTPTPAHTHSLRPRYLPPPPPYPCPSSSSNLSQH